MNFSKDYYNEEPVHYCKHCLSLNIKEISNANLYVCGECGNVNSEETSISNWTAMFIKEYGYNFLSSEEAKLAEE